MTEIYIFVDDSGVFDIKNNKYFIYAGYVFVGTDSMRKYKTRYRNMVDRLKVSLDLDPSVELKAANLEAKHKRALSNVMREAESFSVAVEISRVYESIMETKMNKQRYKDYILKLAIKKKLRKVLEKNSISTSEPIRVIIKIDEQPVSSSGQRELEGSIIKEFLYGRFDGNGYHEPGILNSRSEISLDYMDSKNDYLVQASDILANKIWTGKNYKEDLLRDFNIDNHNHIDLP